MNNASYGTAPGIFNSVSRCDLLAADLCSSSACSGSCEGTYGAHGHHHRMQPVFYLADHGSCLLVRPTDTPPLLLKKRERACCCTMNESISFTSQALSARGLSFNHYPCFYDKAATCYRMLVPLPLFTAACVVDRVRAGNKRVMKAHRLPG